MAALGAPQRFAENGGGFGTLKVLNAVKIYKGAMVGITAAGYAQAFATGNFFAGHAVEEADNTSGAAGAIRVQVRRGTYYGTVPVFSSATVANIGDPVWAVTDNQADLTLSDPGTTKTTTDLVGYVHDIDDVGNVIIRFNTRQN